MPVYDSECYIREAVESIQNQTFSDFEFIIIEDASTDGTLKILDEYTEQDKRIRLVRNTNNIGCPRSLNKGLSQACGKYIARQDADDISLPERLALQVRFLEEHPEIGVVGTWTVPIDEKSQKKGIWKTPNSPVLVKWSLLFGNCITGASVMMHRSLMDENNVYRPDKFPATDYDLWIRLSEKTQLINLSKPLYLRRTHEKMIGIQYYEQQQQITRTLMKQNITKLLGEKIPDALITILWRANHHQFLVTQREFISVANLIRKLHKTYVIKNELKKVERRQIAEDATRRLVQFSLSNYEYCSARATQLLLLVLFLNWRVVNRSHINTIIHNLLKPVLNGKL